MEEAALDKTALDKATLDEVAHRQGNSLVEATPQTRLLLMTKRQRGRGRQPQ